MSEAASRASAPRGRGSARGGRGGFAGRGGRRTNGDKADHKTGAEASNSAFDDEGDIGELRKLYGNKVAVIREMFEDWSEVDVLFALQETNGDENEAVTRIAEGNISQWGEVSKVKKTTKPKAKETTAAPAKDEWSTPAPAARARGGRAVSEGRGRGRATDRGGRGGRGRVAQAGANGARPKENTPLSVPTEESPAWTDEKPAEEPTVSQTTTTESSQPAASAPKTWANLLRQPVAPKAAPKPAPPVSSEPTESQPSVEAPAAEPESQRQPEAVEDETTPVVEQAVPAAPVNVVEPEVALSPSHDELTRTNLEQVVDESKPPATHTAASTAADSWDPRQSTTATPLSAAQQQHVQRQASSGFAASAIKATAERSARTPNLQRRVLDQEEAVRMPGNREVDRAAVQFGAFNLGEEDVDGEREEPETRAQPPADSPISHPRTSLPPVAQPGVSAEAAQRAPGQAPGPQGAAPIAPQSQQYSRFGQPGPQDGPQKPLDPFAQQAATSQAPGFDSFAGQTSQPPSQQPGGAFSSAPSDYSSYYTANDRNAYNSYYGHHYAQQQGQPDSAPGQQRGFGGYGGSQQADNLSQYPQSGAGIQQRFGAGSNDNQNSGHSTPNPTTQAQQQQQPGAAAGAPGSQQSHAQQYAGYANHPYYSNPYYQHYYSNYGQGGFGPYGAGKGGMGYGQPYGMSPNAPFDHQGSPASFAQSSLHRDSGIGSSLDQYGRSGAGSAGQQAGAGAPGLGGASNFGSSHDSFARGASSFQQGFGSQGPASGAAAEDLKPFGDSKSGAGPSPSLGGARPGSAAAGNNAAGGQSGLPPPQSSQLGGNAYGSYPGHMQGLHGSNAYGMGGAGGANQHGSSPYGSYGQGGFGGGSGYGYGGQQQQQQQQRGGWGGNYH